LCGYFLGVVFVTGRDTVTRFLAARAFTKAGDIVMVQTAANAQPAVAEHRRTAAPPTA